MVYINNPIDVTIAPPEGTKRGFQALAQSAAKSLSGMSIEQAMAANRIYQGNGLICQRAMCNSLTGCDSPNGCPNNPNWDQIQQFCGPVNTRGMYMDGSYWTRNPADIGQLLTASAERATGMSPLPTPYNVVGMY